MSEIYSLLNILKTISLLPKKYKLSVSNDKQNVYIEPISFYNSMVRFIHRENRKTTLNIISVTIDKLCTIFDDIVKEWWVNRKINKELAEDINFIREYSIMSSIFIHFKDSIKGMNNLKETYIKDSTMCFELELISHKINKYCRLFENNFKSIINLQEEEKLI